MPRKNAPLPSDVTKVSYLLSRSEKRKLEAEAKRQGVSMSAIITRALENSRLASGAKA